MTEERFVNVGKLWVACRGCGWNFGYLAGQKQVKCPECGDPYTRDKGWNDWGKKHQWCFDPKKWEPVPFKNPCTVKDKNK